MAKKNKTKLYIGIGIGILAIGGLVFFLIKRKKKKGNLGIPDTTPSVTSSGSGSGSGSSSSSSSAPTYNQNFPLNVGSRGNRVYNVQAYLNSTKGKYGLVVDGIYGSKTADALKRWKGKTEVTKSYYDWIKTQPSSTY